MGKGSKIVGFLFLILGLASIGAYFVIGDKFSNVTVVFDSNGGSSVPEQVISKGGRATRPVDPTKENSEFVEWRLNDSVYNFDDVVNSNITLRAFWNDIVQYSVQVNLEGIDYTATLREGEMLTVELLNIPMRDGYTVNFYDENNNLYDLNTPISSNLVLTANYEEIQTYVVKFNSDGGEKVADIKVNEGNTIQEPTSTKEGYQLDGWYLGEQKFDFGTPINKDITLKAKWNDGPKVDVIFMSDGTVYKTISVKENSTVKKPTNPTKKGYKFIEWQLDGTAFDFKTKITTETTLTALFEEVTSYKVTFDSNGGSSVKSQEVTDKATRPTNPTKSGYKFVEWQLNGTKYEFDTPVTSDIELKALWEVEKAKYTVTFKNDDETEITTQTVEEGKTATRPANPTKDGYRFVDWLYEHSPFSFDTPITKNIVLYAHFERVTDTPDVIEPTINENNEN